MSTFVETDNNTNFKKKNNNKYYIKRQQSQLTKANNITTSSIAFLSSDLYDVTRLSRHQLTWSRTRYYFSRQKANHLRSFQGFTSDYHEAKTTTYDVIF